MSTVVIVATRGRPQELSNLIDALALQTVLADKIIVSACDHSDVQSVTAGNNLELLFGSPGSSVQRNRALALARGMYDNVVFFDDDFVPSRYWIDHVQLLLAAHSDVICVTGTVLVDGVTMGGMGWSEGQRIVDEADRSRKTEPTSYKLQTGRSPYGCNMAFRAKDIENIVFDERLALYGWLEDRDFSSRAAPKSRMISTDLLWGVHLGSTRGRTSGLRYGYSQVVNPWYLMKKGSMSHLEAFLYIARGLSRNALGYVFRSSTVDRPGRFRGNLIGLRDVINGSWAPEKIIEL